MNVEEYLKETNSTEMKPGTDANSEDDPNDGLSLNDPDDIQKNLARFDELDSNYLHEKVSELCGGVDYLGTLDEAKEGKQVSGVIVEPNHRLILDLPCRRETPCPPGVNPEELVLPPFRHVFFVVDTSSPESYLSVEAMQILSSMTGGDVSTCTIPDFLDVELCTGAKVEFHLSPGNNSEVNILGGSVLKLADISTSVKDQEFFLNFVE